MTSPGCRHGDCCCWSRCHNSADSMTSPLLSDASTCSSVGRKIKKERLRGVAGLGSSRDYRLGCVCFSHQWVCVAVALRHLLPGSFSGRREAIEAHVFGAELQQGGPVTLRWRWWPGVGVNHPGSWVLPRCPAAVQLWRKMKQVRSHFGFI